MNKFFLLFRVFVINDNVKEYLIEKQPQIDVKTQSLIGGGLGAL